MNKKYTTNETTTAGSVAAVAMPMGSNKKSKKKMYNPDGTMKNALDVKQRIVNGGDKYNKEENAMKKRTNENLGDMAHMAEQDHEVQMARADLYKIAKYAIKLHEMLKNISEAEGLEGWQQAKITKASDYISSVYHNLDYSMKFDGAGELGEGKYKSDAQRKAVHAAKAKKESVYKKKMHENLSEKLTKSMSAGDIIADFQSSDDPKFKGKSKEERKQMALGAYYDMHPEKSKKKVKESNQTLMTEEQFDEAAGEKDACYHKVKSRYKVWPSAYASAALSKCRKVGAKNWGNKSKK